MDPLETGTIVALAALVVVFILFRLESTVPIAVGLGLLVGCAITIAIGKGAVANQIAIYAYYCLVVGVVLLLVQHTRTAPTDKLDDWVTAARFLVVRRIKRVTGGTTYKAAKIVQIRSQVTYEETLRTKDQMMRAKAIQDDLRKRSGGWEEAEGVREWQEERMQLLDISVIILWFSEQRNTAEALDIRQRVLEGQVKAIVPHFVIHRLALALKNEAHLSGDDVVAAVKSVKDMCLIVSLQVYNLNKEASKLASRYKIDVYNAFSLALANELGADFVTADRALYESISQLKFVRFVGHVDESKGV